MDGLLDLVEPADVGEGDVLGGADGACDDRLVGRGRGAGRLGRAAEDDLELGLQGGGAADDAGAAGGVEQPRGEREVALRERELPGGHERVVRELAGVERGAQAVEVVAHQPLRDATAAAIQDQTQKTTQAMVAATASPAIPVVRRSESTTTAPIHVWMAP